MTKNPMGEFTKMVPGFDFLQGLAKTAGSAIPSVGQWVAPTLDPAEIEKRIEELRTVQFWLEQNVRMIGATIQAMEVQRMTLTTLKTMNVQMGDLQEAMKIRLPEMMTKPPAAEAPAAPAPPAPKEAGRDDAAPAAASPMVDPMQWWGALTKQFSELAASALKDNPAASAASAAGQMVKQSIDAAGETLQKAAQMPAAVARQAGAAAKAPARKAARTPAKAPAGTSAKSARKTGGRR